MKIIHIFAPQNHSNRSVCDAGKMASHSFVTRHCEALQRQDHSSIEYIYAADGTKLRTIHRPSSSSALTDSIDYIGNLILKNGQPSMYLFDGGFASFDANGAVDGWHYYIQDYMGNNRMVVNSGGAVEQITHYYPYGGVIGDISTNENVQKYKFEGKELDRTFGLDNYDIHARQYFAMMPSWDRIDPLAEKYYGIGPYAYCGGDPVNRIDPTGKYIKFAEGSSATFIGQFYQAYEALSKAGAAEMINQAWYDPSFTITIKESDVSQFDGKNNEISWDPASAVLTDENYILTPMEVLNHEFDHGVYYQKASDEEKKQMNDPDSQYRNQEERRVIEGSEQDTALKLGRIKSGQVTRTNHQGTTFPVSDPLSDETLYVIFYEQE